MMPLRLNVQSTAWNENTLFLNVTEAEELPNWKDSERMLVDSDGLAFIYVLENDKGFVYIALENSHWEEVKKAMKNSEVFLRNEAGDELALKAFNGEMEYLIENIKGNANYGQRMEDEVVKVFGSGETAQ
jgi:hypothetical protein